MGEQTSSLPNPKLDPWTRTPYRGIAVISFTGAAIGCFIASSLFALAILWPFRFGFSLSAREMLREVGQRHATAIDTYRELALRLELNYDSNSERIKPLFWLLRGAILFLVVEVAAWIIVLWRA